MRVFVLTVGRTGSSTFAAACAHAENFTAGHETNIDRITGRFEYPNNHIEVDNRLSWLLGALHAAHPDAFYVHLQRDRSAVARSYARRSIDQLTGKRRMVEFVKRFRGRTRVPLVDAFAHGIIRTRGVLPDVTPAAELMVDVVNANIVEFLRGKAHLTVDLADGAALIADVWDAIGAVGDLDAARAEFGVFHNASS